MSISQSFGSKKIEGWTQPRMIRSEPRPRMLQNPDFANDEETRVVGEPRPSVGQRPSTASCSFPTSPHGNAKAQEPAYPRLRPLNNKARPSMSVMHDHPRPWTFSPQLGKREHPHVANPQHHSWMIDQGNQGRWNKERKIAYYKSKDEHMMALKPHDEKCAVGTNMKFWTHLTDGGTKKGGQEKLVLVPERATGLHLKYGLYEGKFENIRHHQVTVKKNGWEVDIRPRFDNRLKDDNVRANEESDRGAYGTAFDLFRPKHTRSCPRMGADFMQR